MCALTLCSWDVAASGCGLESCRGRDLILSVVWTVPCRDNYLKAVDEGVPLPLMTGLEAAAGGRKYLRCLHCMQAQHRSVGQHMWQLVQMCWGTLRS